MILVDTSVLTDLLRGRETHGTEYLREVIGQGLPFALTPIVVQETLQGARDIGEWRRLLPYLSSQEMLFDPDPTASAVASARIYFDCRRRGLTPRSTIDCSIAQIAISHGVPLLHTDKDYDAIARIRPLKTLP